MLHIPKIIALDKTHRKGRDNVTAEKAPLGCLAFDRNATL